MNRPAAYAITALLALLAGLCALAVCGITPFGNATLCWQDNGQQVASDFGYLRGVWEGRHTLDWSYACGGSPRSSFHPTFNNLVSPLTWAVAAIPGISAVTGLSLLFLLQLTLLPLGALCYLRRRFPRLPAAWGMALALAYAFGGFVLSKYTFLPFLNVAILFPWYVAALDSLLRRGRWLPCCLLLAFMLAVGTYFAWMWLLFTAVYAAARTGWRWQSPLRQHTLCLFLASALALFLSAFSWLPSLLVTAASGRAGEAHFWWNATRAELVPGGLSSLLGLSVLLSLLLLLPAWRHLRCNRYALSLLVLLVGLVCVSATTLWHLSRPWDFAGRFGYMAEFMLICWAAQAACRLRGRRWCRPLAAAALPVLVALAALVLSEQLWMETWLRRASYQAAADRVYLAEWAAQQVPAPGGRATSRGNAAVENLAFFTPFDTLSHFTACITPSQEETLARWGYQQRVAVISGEGGTLATDTLLGMRYILSQAGAEAPYRLEENPHYFGVGLMVPETLFPLPPQAADPIDCQQTILTRLLGAEHAGSRSKVFAWEPLALSPDSLHYLQQPGNGLTCSCEGWAHERWGGVESLPRLAEIPAAASLIQSDVVGVELSLYHLPKTSLEALKRYGQELPVRCAYAGRRMSITCRSTEERCMLFLPLLWQKGYEARVDGEPLPVQNLDGFVGISMPAAGEHRVELRYRAPGKSAGFIISVAALPLLLGAWWGTRRRPAFAPTGPLNSLCRHLLLAVSVVLLFWPLIVLPVGVLWR